jgi:Zn-finger nucleic acid-binding protein
VEVDGCPGCGGLWLDKGELPKLSANPNVLRILGNEVRATQPPPSPQKSDLCPRCNEPLSAFEFNSMRGIRLDRCRKCEGVWLDSGEAQEIAEKLGAQPQSAPAAAVVAGAAASPAIAARFAPPPPAGAASANSARNEARPRPVEKAPGAPEPADPTSTAGLPVVRGQPMQGYPGGGGFFGNIERGIHFIGGAYKLALECPALLTPLIVGASVQLILGGAMFTFFMLQGRAGGHATVHSSGSAAMAILGIALLFAAQLANMTILGMTVSMVDAYLKGLTPKLGNAWRDVMKNLGGVVAMAVVSTIVEMLTAKNKRGSRGFIGEIVNQFWTVMSFLLMPVIMIEDVGLGRALARVRDIHRRGILQVAVGEVGLRAIAGISAFLAIGLIMILGVALMPLTLTKIIVLGVSLLLVLVPIGVLNAFARGAYYTCLYLWAAEIERVGEAKAVVPGPLATALVPTRD